jgi:hypothetical protein
MPIPPERRKFAIDDRLHIAIEYGLAMDIKEIILEHGSDNPAIMAFALSLRGIENRDNPPESDYDRADEPSMTE